ncbi:Acidic repeat-containing protein [Talaromyces islandicus]|uniref:Acidic repeat-containing protein n=1 Tax=Talaromyces islandicus TaxID=28573 RepID=A0A0U1M4R8_TALIS|nr:Acidic repeat-containing protein [Talaromyces islandicus]
MAATDSDHALTGDDTSDAEATETMVESLVSGREKRSTAGRNMSSLLDAAADDDLTLLFAEDEHDDEFDEDEGAEGEQAEEMSSSEDEDDQGPNAADDDFEGEKELEKQAKADRKKRKAQESLRLTALRKKIKIDPTVSSNVPAAAAAAARPKKKSERISWLPTPEEGPVRSSSRRQTMQNKEMTHARLKDSEQRRIKLIATMEQAAKKKEKTKPKVRTQAERLAEAEKIERMNSKSLNRWEEMEKRKAEERKAKLEALQNRRLEGPVMSWWSGVAKWVNGKLVRVGNVEVKPKPDKEEIERKKKMKDSKDSAQDTAKQDKPETGTPSQPPEGQGPSSISSQPHTTGNENQQTSKVPTAEIESGKATAGNGFLDGIHQYASLPESPAAEVEASVKNNDAPDATAPKPDEESNLSKPTGDNSENSNDQGENQIVPAEKASPKPDETAPGTEDTQAQEELEEKRNKASQEAVASEDISPRPEEAPDNTQINDETQDKEMLDAPPESKTADIELDESKNEQQSQDTPLSTDTPAAENNAPEESKTTSETSPVEPVKPATETEMESNTLTTSEVQPAIVPPSNPAAEGSEMDIDPVIATDLPSESEPSAPLEPQVVEQTGRNLMVLENFDNATSQSRQYSIYFNSKKPPRLAKISSHLCPITSQPSRYRDPETELPFASALAYTEIRNLTEQKYIWSGMLGCYIGSPTVAAKGVPEQFLTGVKAEKKDEAEKEKPAAAVSEPVDEDKA